MAKKNVRKNAQSSETYEKQFSYFYFMRNGRFCTKKKYLKKLTKMNHQKWPKKIVQKMRNVLKPIKKQFSDFCNFYFVA